MIITSYEDAVKLAMAGVEDGYRWLYDNTCKDVYAYLYAETGNDREKADQKINEVYGKAWQELPKLADPGRFPTWVYELAQEMMKDGKHIPVLPIGANLGANAGPAAGAGISNAAPHVEHVASSSNFQQMNASPNVAHVHKPAGPETGGAPGSTPATGGAPGSGMQFGASNGIGGKAAGGAGKKVAGEAGKKAAGGLIKTTAGKAIIGVSAITVATATSAIVYNHVKEDKKEETTTTAPSLDDTEETAGGMYVIQNQTITVDGKTYEFDYSYDPDRKTLALNNVPDVDMNSAQTAMTYSAPVNLNEVLCPYQSDFIQPDDLTYLSGGVITDPAIDEGTGVPCEISYTQTDYGLVFNNTLPHSTALDMMETVDGNGNVTSISMDTGGEYALFQAFSYDQNGRMEADLEYHALQAVEWSDRNEYTYLGRRYTYDVDGDTIKVTETGLYTPYSKADYESAPYRYTIPIAGITQELRLIDSDMYAGEYTVQMSGGRVVSVSGTETYITEDNDTRTEEFNMAFSYPDGGMIIDMTEHITYNVFNGEEVETIQTENTVTREYTLVGKESGQAGTGDSTIEDSTENPEDSGTSDRQTSDLYDYDGNVYVFIQDDDIFTWNDAEAYCESIGGHLAVISSREENDFLYNLMQMYGYESAYFGYTDQEEEGKWRWVKDEGGSYVNWAPNEPSNDYGIENYGMFYYKFTDGTWNDGDFGVNTVNDGRVFICEWDDPDTAYKNGFGNKDSSGNQGKTGDQSGDGKNGDLSGCYAEYARLMEEYMNLDLQPFYHPQNGASVFYGYAIRDINSDGTPELILVGNDTGDRRYEFFRLYTYSNGKVVSLVTDDYGKSLEYGISGNKIRLYNTMLGTGIAGEAAFTLEPNADKLTVKEAISYCATDPGKDIKYYRVTESDGIEGGADDMKYFCFEYTPDSSYHGHEISDAEYKAGISGYDFLGLDFEVTELTSAEIEKVRNMK